MQPEGQIERMRRERNNKKLSEKSEKKPDMHTVFSVSM
jgi:hypothetical protein